MFGVSMKYLCEPMCTQERIIVSFPFAHSNLRIIVIDMKPVKFSRIAPFKTYSVKIHSCSRFSSRNIRSAMADTLEAVSFVYCSLRLVIRRHMYRIVQYFIFCVCVHSARAVSTHMHGIFTNYILLRTPKYTLARFQTPDGIPLSYFFICDFSE